MSQFDDWAFATLQHLLPKHLLSRIIYSAMRSENVWLRNRILSVFLRSYRVDMSEAVESDPRSFRSFNAFFTRALKGDARPIASKADAFVSPVDGTVSQCGEIDGGSLPGQQRRLIGRIEQSHHTTHARRIQIVIIRG